MTGETARANAPVKVCGISYGSEDNCHWWDYEHEHCILLEESRPVGTPRCEYGGFRFVPEEYSILKKQSETYRFLFGEEGIKVATLDKIQMWRNKAEDLDEFIETHKQRYYDLEEYTRKLEDKAEKWDKVRKILGVES